MGYHSEVGHPSRLPNDIAENPGASCSRPRIKLRDFLLSDKPALSHADFHHEVTRVDDIGLSKSSGRQESHGAQGRARNDGIVKQTSRLLEEKGKEIQEELSTVSSGYWRQFDKMYKHSPTPYKSNGISPTSSSSYFSTDGSSSTSSRGNSSSPGHQRSHRSPSQSRVETSFLKTYIRDECFSARGKSPARQITYHLVPQSNRPKQYSQQDQSEDVNHFRRIVASYPPRNMIKQQKVCVVDQNRAANLSDVRPDTYERRISYSNTRSEIGKQHKDGNLELASTWEGNMRIQESEVKEEILPLNEPSLGHYNSACMKKQRESGRSPSQYSRNSSSSASNLQTTGVKGLKSPLNKDNYMQLHCPDTHSHVPNSCHLPSTDNGIGNLQSEIRVSCSKATSNPQGVQVSARRFETPPRSRNTVDTKVSPGLKSSSTSKLPRVLDRRSGPDSVPKVRQPSPIRRLSSAVGSFIRSAGSRENSPLRRSNPKDSVAKPEQDKSCTEKSQANNRARSSPIRRLLDPLLKSKAPNAREVAHVSKIDNSTSGHCKSSVEQLQVAKSANSVKASPQNLKQGSTSLQALLQVSVKNGLPLFTFAVDDDCDILAATLKKSSAPERSRPSWIYTFFTIHEMKKKNGLWLNHGSKGNGNNYVPNVLAQMKVSNHQFPIDTKENATDDVHLREFTLFSVDTRQVDQHATEFQPTTELAAIVANLLKTGSNKSINPSDMSSTKCQSLLSTNVILPGDVHTIPIKGPVSTLTQRWRNGGSCDCGGWDVGCQLRIFNHDECKKSLNLVKTTTCSNEFKLFSQVGEETQPVLSLKPYKDRIHSVEFESSFSLLQAFATSVAVLDCRRFVSDINVVEGRASTSVSNFDDPFLRKVDSESQGEAFTGHVPYPPPHSPVGRV